MLRNLLNRQIVGTVGAACLLMAMSTACGTKKDQPEQLSAASFLPENLAQDSIVRTSEIRTFVGQSLFEYINGGAELYHKYHFQEVATADYRYGAVDLVIDIYAFADAERAFGMYSTLRPDNPRSIDLGVEGFSAGTEIDFVKGKFIARVTGYDGSEETIGAIELAASALEKILPGRSRLPEYFGLLPREGMIVHSEKFYAESFQGWEFLSEVYTRMYTFDGDTVLIFLTKDSTGEKLKLWREKVSKREDADPEISDLPFEGSSSFITDSYSGTLVAGRKGGLLLGAVNFGDSNRELLDLWLRGLNRK